MVAKALITGISGQDGSYLTELLIAKGYQVFGTSRSGTLPDLSPQLKTDAVTSISCESYAAKGRIRQVIVDVMPDEIYHLAADSFVPNGWADPANNMISNYGMTLEILNAIRDDCPSTRLVNACSREVFGDIDGLANESTAMYPVTPYGINKAASRWMVDAYREKYGLFATNAILFNHESPRRGEQFVTRKVSLGVAAICRRQATSLELGNLHSQRDWGFAGDYVDAMWRMLQTEKAMDFVIGTGITHSIQDLVETAFSSQGLKWRDYVKASDSLVRQNDESVLAADISAAKSKLQWEPATDFEKLVQMMVQADLRT
ncbi:MAG: GDP-mannose 4,6-dehydratase [Planctomycetota bacterium]